MLNGWVNAQRQSNDSESSGKFPETLRDSHGLFFVNGAKNPGTSMTNRLRLTRNRRETHILDTHGHLGPPRTSGPFWHVWGRGAPGSATP